MNLSLFNTANLFEAATNLFQQLGIKLNSNTAEPLPAKDLLKQYYKDNDTFKTIGKTYFIGIIDNTVFHATGMFDHDSYRGYSYKEALQQGDKNYDGLMLFALELSKQPNRTEISDLTRTFNRISQKMPVALVLKYKTGNEACFSIAISERFKYKQNWRQGEKAGKVIILRDIQTETTHAGHERILLDLVKPVGVTNYDKLHQHWLQVLDVNILNKKFFQELANWYFWAIENVSFPDDLEKRKDVRNSTNLIRLITRVVFIWFIKEKSLVPNALFDKRHLDKILKDFNRNKKSQNYYQAILQNLFFGTLNQKMDERKFVESHSGFVKSDQSIRNFYRYPEKFTISEKEVIKLFADVPFLNGGLFDCLDKTNEETKKDSFVDGFTRITAKQANIPDYIFFGEEREVDLNAIYATKNKKYKSRGLINLLESYKFTVAENTPIEEEIALDPELLGKVFENLLASYNPETQTTARKQTGSFYTPREIVNYMVDESLLEYIKQNVKNDDADFELRLRELISYSETPNPFNEQETKALIEGINNCKILDPACGSGAFPMGILHKMVHLLQKLDPGNKLWKAQQKENIIGDQIKLLEKDREAIKGLSDKSVREKAEKAVAARLKEVDEIFESKNNFDDYARKLYLIENCIYGIDIQPIAVQISKLRFFISLIIDQKKQPSKENFGIRSLPNLETKFVAANTLIGLEISNHDLFKENNKLTILQNKLKLIRHEYFTANNRKQKSTLIDQDKELRKQIADCLNEILIQQNQNVIHKKKNEILGEQRKIEILEKSPEEIKSYEVINLFGVKEITIINVKKEKIKEKKNLLKKLLEQLEIISREKYKDEIIKFSNQVASYDPYDQNKSTQWFEAEWMFGLTTGFDIVIGNPPYIKEYTFREAFEAVRTSKYYQGKMDLWYLFACKNLDLLKKKSGILCFIATNNWTTNFGASKMRTKILNDSQIHLILDFGSYMIFESADIQTMVMLFRNDNSKNNYNFELRRLVGDKIVFDDVLDLISNKQTDKTEYLIPLISKDNLKDKSFTFSNDAFETVLNKIKSKANFVLTEHEIANGIHPHYDYVSKATQKVLGDRFRVGQGIFVLSDDEKEDLDLNKKEFALIKPYYTTKQIQKWYGDSKNEEWIIYTDSKFKQPENIKPFPNIKKHLDKFQKVITSDNKPYGLHRAREEWFFNDEKIIVLRKCTNEPIFTYTDFDCYVSATFYVIKSERINLKYLTAILNSKLIEFWLRNKGKMQGNNYQLDKEPLLQIPIFTYANPKPIIAIVDSIIIRKKANKDSSFFERLIDAMVYELYLPEEIKAGGAEVLKHLTNLPELKEGQDEKNLKTIEKVYKELSDPKHPIRAALLKLLTIEEVNLIEGSK